jgi:hypothetical protein
MATVLKTVIGASLSWVQIPAPPPYSYSKSLEFPVRFLKRHSLGRFEGQFGGNICKRRLESRADYFTESEEIRGNHSSSIASRVAVDPLADLTNRVRAVTGIEPHLR